MAILVDGVELFGQHCRGPNKDHLCEVIMN